jgi:hypothetical protein
MDLLARVNRDDDLLAILHGREARTETPRRLWVEHRVYPGA